MALQAFIVIDPDDNYLLNTLNSNEFHSKYEAVDDECKSSVDDSGLDVWKIFEKAGYRCVELNCEERD